MTSTTSFTYDIQATQSLGGTQQPELFALAPVTKFSLPDHTVLVRNPQNSREMVLTAEVMSAMDRCDTFKTLDEHVSVLMEGGDQSNNKRNAIADVVRAVHQGGLTVSAGEICARLNPDHDSAPLAALPIVVIITCDRPKALKRLLESLLAVCDLSQVKRVFVVDDSRDPGNASLNRTNTLECNKQSVTEIIYFGASAARDLEQNLIRRLPQHENEIRFLIGREQWKNHYSAGVARNYSLLLSIGSPVVVFDDDALCRAHDSPFSETGLEFSTHRRQAHFFKLQDQAEFPQPCADPDPVRRHMRCLGLSVPGALNVLGSKTLDQNALRSADASFVQRIDQHSKILVTECGTLGDPGTASDRWVATVPSKSLRRLLEDPARIESALGRRNCWLGMERPTFTPKANMSQVTGIDNRDLLPPYVPIERGQDKIFGNTLHYLFPNSVCLNYAWAIPHLPIPPRQPSTIDNESVGVATFPGDITSQIIAKMQSCEAEDPGLRLEYLATLMRDLANSPKKFIRNLNSETWLEYKLSYIVKLQSVLEASKGAPQSWVTFLQKSIQKFQAASSDPPILAKTGDFPLPPGSDDLVEFWQSNWNSFGRGLLAWPDIRREAKTVVDATFPLNPAP